MRAGGVLVPEDMHGRNDLIDVLLSDSDPSGIRRSLLCKFTQCIERNICCPVARNKQGGIAQALRPQYWKMAIAKLPCLPHTRKPTWC